MTSLLNFYQQHGISPVKQDITDLSAHFARRAALYRSLGLSQMAVRGSTVMEVGPGSGENALYTLSLKPRVFIAVEPNPIAAAAARTRLGVPVAETPIEACEVGERFDFVLCEGLLGLCGTDPLVLLEAVARHVAPGGVLVITCIDPISDCAEVWRRALAHRLLDRSMSLTDQVATLRPVFTAHLATLKGMTRSVDDWILDNILNPASIGPTFSIPTACAALDGRFDVLGSSPRFLTDWRWYKDAPSGNQWAIDAYWRQAHNLFDYRRVRPEQQPALNRILFDHCVTYRAAVHAYEQGRLSECPALPPETPCDLPSWFGRGQQYLSFVRRS